jgi:hypothetical protein
MPVATWPTSPQHSATRTRPGKTVYQANAARLDKEIAALDGEIRTTFKRAAGRTAQGRDLA